AGTAHAGWQLARAALAAAEAIGQGSTDAFYLNKIATAVQYAVHVLPRVQALNASVQQGGLANQYASQVQI
ncbi:MAG: acyl-CoA dehydrogenase C-terminal domain-containing protein, partial [Castellaniella sp.]